MTTIIIRNNKQFVTIGDDNDSISISGSDDVVTIGDGNDTIRVTGSDDSITAGNGTDSITAGPNSTITAGNGPDTVNAGADSKIILGNGTDSITAGPNSTITAGNGPDTVNAGADSKIILGNGTDSITAGPNSTITAGNGPDTVNAGADSKIILGNGTDSITAGPNSTITAGNGPDTVNAGADSKIILGNGIDTVNAGAGDTVTIGQGSDTIDYDGLTPNLGVPASVSGLEGQPIALPITVGTPAFGHEVVNGFNASNDKIELDTADFANFAAVKADARQIGSNTVITLDTGDTITLTGVALSSLSAANFTFFTGAPADSITITGIPSNASLSDSAGPLAVTNGSITLTPAQLAGLAITPANDANFTLSVTATNTAGQTASSAGTIAVTVDPLAPTVAPVAASGVEGSAIALNLGVTVNGLTGDTNSLASLVVNAIPVGAVLSDGGTNNFTATSGGTSVDVHAWNLSTLTITPANDTNFTLTVAATEKDAAGTLSTTTTSTEAGTVDPLAPTVAPVAASGVEGSAILLNLGVTVNSETGVNGDSPANSLASLVVSAIPVGAVLSDGGTNNFTATSGSTSVDVHAWNLSTLTITPANDTNFTLTVAATEKDAAGTLSATTTGTEAGTVDPLAPTVAPVAATGVEGSAIALNLGVTVNGLTGDTNSLASLVVSAIPVGAVLSDGGTNNFTATSGSTSVDVHAWNLSTLTITPANDTNFTLTVAATEKDAAGTLSTTTTSTEAVTVDPLAPTVAPVAASGVEGSAIALNLEVTVNGLTGDTNSLASLVVSAIPVGAVLSDGGTNNFTATSGSTSVDVHAWNLSTLTITPANDTNFTLTVAATEKDAAGTLSATTTGTEAGTVDPLAPTVAPVAATGVEGSAIALNLGVTVNGLTGDTNSLASLVVNAIPVGAVLSDGGTNNFTATSGGTSVDVHAWNLSTLTITPANDTNFTLTVAATEKDAAGTLSTTTTSTEAGTVDPLAPTVAPVAASGVEGSAILLNLGVTVNSETGVNGDSPANSLASLVVSAIPVGAVLSDGGTNNFTATSGSTSVDVHAWNLSTLTITPANDTNFTLTVAATEKDAAGTLSATTTGTKAVTVAPGAPNLIIATSGGPVTDFLGVANVTPYDRSDTVSLTIAGLPTGATLSEGAGFLGGGSPGPGTNNDNGSWTLIEAQAQLIGSSPTPYYFYQFNPVVSLPSGTVADLTVTATETNAEGAKTSSVPHSFELDPDGGTVPTVTVAITPSLNEGATVPFDISLSPADPSDSITITGLPADAMLSVGNNNGGGSWTLTEAQLAGLTLTAGGTTGEVSVNIGTVENPENVLVPNSVLFGVKVTGLFTALTGISLGGNPAYSLTVDAVAPTLTIANNSLMVVEGGTVALGVSETPADPSDPISVTITGVPSGDMLSTGTNNGGSWTLTPEQLAGLTLTAGGGAAASATLTVTAINTGSLTSDLTPASSTQTIALTVNAGVAPALTIASDSLSVKEDRKVALGIGETPFSPSDPISLTITGVPADAKLSAGTNNGDGSWTLTPAQLIGLTLTAGEVTTATLTVTATNTGGATPASTSDTIALTVNPAAPTLTIADRSLSVSEDGLVPLGISVTPADPLDTVSVTIAGIPSGASLSDSGVALAVSNESITLMPAQLAGLTLTAGGAATTATLTVTATNTPSEGAPVSLAKTIDLTVNQPMAPTLTIANNSLTVGEDGSVLLGIGETPFDPTDMVSVTITGVPSDASLTAGTKNTDGTWTLTREQLAGLMLIAGEGTTASLTVTATNTEGGVAASSSQTIALTVNPIAPTLSIANNDLTVGAGGSVVLGISETPFDSRDNVSVTIAGIPYGDVLSDSTGELYDYTYYRNPNPEESFTLSPAQLDGLALTLTTGPAELTVTATNTEGAQASAVQQTIFVTPSMAPVLTVPPSLAVVVNYSIPLGISETPSNSSDTVSITITGVASGASLSTGTNNGGGSWTLTPAQLAGLQLDAGESGNATLTVTATETNAAGAQASSPPQEIALSVNPDGIGNTPPTVSVAVGAPVSGDPVTETRLDINAIANSTYNPSNLTDAYSDGSLTQIQLSGVPTDVSLSVTGGNGLPETLTPTLDANGTTDDYTLGGDGSEYFTDEVDVRAPSGQSTNFNLGVTAISTSPDGGQVSATTSQNIEVDYSTVSDNPTFSSVNQSIWNSGSAFVKTFANSFFVTANKTAQQTVAGEKVVGTGFLKAGLQSDLNVNSGSFNGTLPFNVTLDDTYNKTNNTLEIDPAASQSGGGSFTTTGAGGSYTLDLILDAYAKVSVSGLLGTAHKTVPLNTTVPLLNFNSTNLKYVANLPDGIGTATVQWPQVNTTSKTNPSTGTLSSQGGTSPPVFNLNINPIDVLADIFTEGKNPFQGTFFGGHVSYTLLAATVAPGIDLKQNFNLNASLPTATLTGGSVNDPLTFGTPLVIDNASSQDPGLGFNLSLTPNATLENDTSLAGQLMLGVKALAGNLTLTVAGHGPKTSFGPLVTKTTTLHLGTTPSIYNKTFPVAFQPQIVTFHAP